MPSKLYVFLVVVLANSACTGESNSSSPTEQPVGTDSEALDSMVHEPPSLNSIQSGEHNAAGESEDILCATCHELPDAPYELPTTTEALGEPHQNLRFRHGHLPCAACHADRYDRLHLANGDQIPMTEAMQLCRQCHGIQARDYDHAAHGGMRGYWDPSRGPQLRNHCTDCHDPHSPRFPHFQPVMTPRAPYAPAVNHSR